MIMKSIGTKGQEDIHLIQRGLPRTNVIGLQLFEYKRSRGKVSYEYENFRKAVEQLKKAARDLEPKRGLDSEVNQGDIAPELELKMESQLLDYDTVCKYLPERWEMPRDGKLLYFDRELQEAMKVLIFNLGVESTLNLIPRNLIETYLEKENDIDDLD
jgi:hypothetical protein